MKKLNIFFIIFILTICLMVTYHLIFGFEDMLLIEIIKYNLLVCPIAAVFWAIFIKKGYLKYSFLLFSLLNICLYLNPYRELIYIRTSGKHVIMYLQDYKKENGIYPDSLDEKIFNDINFIKANGERKFG